MWTIGAGNMPKFLSVSDKKGNIHIINMSEVQDFIEQGPETTGILLKGRDTVEIFDIDIKRIIEFIEGSS